MATTKIPIIDVSSFREKECPDKETQETVARAWDEAFSTMGFAMIIGHGVPSDLIADLRRHANEFFEQPTETKMKFHRGPYGSPEGGYNGVGQESVSLSRDKLGSDGGAGPDGSPESEEEEPAGPDMVESFILRPSRQDKDPPELAKVGLEYRNEMLRVLTCLHELSAKALGLDKDFFVSFYDTIDQHSLRLGYFPACAEPPPPNVLRYGEHTDYTGFTILLQDDSDTSTSSGGLEVKLPDGSFHAVQAVPHAFVVNIGDMFQVWTNDRWKSTVHRVSSPTKPCGSRLSVPFFSGPNNEAKIAPILVQPGDAPKHETITAGEHLWRKLKATQT